MRALVYIRVSSDEQVDNTSLESQERLCRDFAEREGLDVLDIIRDEGESAKTAKRPGLLAALSRCRKEAVDFLIVHKIDRLSRNTADYHAIRATLAASGTVIKSASETLADDPAGRLLETMLASIAQFDNEVRGERSKRGMQSALAAGGWTYKPPTGYKNKRIGTLPSLTPDPEIAHRIQAALKAYAAGNGNQKTVADAIGVSGQTAKKILCNPVYAGFHEYLGYEVNGSWEPLITRAEYDSIQARMMKGRVYVSERQEFPLRGFLACECGHKITASNSKSKTGRLYAYYHCTACGNRHAAKDVESEFLAMLENEALPDYMFAHWERIVRFHIHDRHATAQKEAEAQQRKVAAMKRKRERLLNLLIDGTIDEAVFKERDGKLRDELTVASVVASESDIHFYDLDATLSFAKDLLRTPAKYWLGMQLNIKQDLQDLFFQDGLILPLRTPQHKEPQGLIRPSGSESILASRRGIEPRLPA